MSDRMLQPPEKAPVFGQGLSVINKINNYQLKKRIGQGYHFLL